MEAAAVMGAGQLQWYDDASMHWLRRATQSLRAAHPEISIATSVHPWVGDNDGKLPEICDFYEPHIWMAGGEFYQRLGWTFQHKWDNEEFELVAKFGEKLYRSNEAYWLQHLQQTINDVAAHATSAQRPLITTECWGIVDYKDGPLLNWDWVKDCCAAGTRYAAATGAWAAIATSNFCGPQFVSMWRDIAWHRELTDLIKRSKLPQWPSKLTGIQPL